MNQLIEIAKYLPRMNLPTAEQDNILKVFARTTTVITEVHAPIWNAGGHWLMPFQLSNGYVGCLCIGIDELTLSGSPMPLADWVRMFQSEDTEDAYTDLFSGGLQDGESFEDFMGTWIDPVFAQVMLSKLNKWGDL